jgi:hypothetical protein
LLGRTRAMTATRLHLSAAGGIRARFLSDKGDNRGKRNHQADKRSPIHVDSLIANCEVARLRVLIGARRNPISL